MQQYKTKIIGLQFYNLSQDSVPKSKPSFGQITHFNRFQANDLPRGKIQEGQSESKYFGSPNNKGDK